MESGALYFNPRSPYGERLEAEGIVFLGLLFQSTLPVRGATAEGASTLASGSISIHAPRTGSDGRRNVLHVMSRISIHAPRTGSDAAGAVPSMLTRISIHAPRTGSDQNRGRPEPEP